MYEKHSAEKIRNVAKRVKWWTTCQKNHFERWVGQDAKEMLSLSMPPDTHSMPPHFCGRYGKADTQLETYLRWRAGSACMKRLQKPLSSAEYGIRTDGTPRGDLHRRGLRRVLFEFLETCVQEKPSDSESRVPRVEFYRISV